MTPDAYCLIMAQAAGSAVGDRVKRLLEVESGVEELEMSSSEVKNSGTLGSKLARKCHSVLSTHIPLCLQQFAIVS